MAGLSRREYDEDGEGTLDRRLARAREVLGQSVDSNLRNYDFYESSKMDTLMKLLEVRVDERTFAYQLLAHSIQV